MGVGEWGGQLRCWTQKNGRRAGQEIMGYGGCCSGEGFKRLARAVARTVQRKNFTYDKISIYLI